MYIKHTGVSQERIESSMERDKFMSPAEAVEFGLIDQILVRPKKPDDHSPSPQSPLVGAIDNKNVLDLSTVNFKEEPIKDK